MRPHHRFLLAQQLSHIDFLDEQIEALSQAIERHMAESETAGPAGSPSSETVDPTTGEVQEQAPTPETKPPVSFSQAVALLDTIPGVNHRLAEIIVAELGTDMSRFPTAKHAAAWAGVARSFTRSSGCCSSLQSCWQNPRGQSGFARCLE